MTPERVLRVSSTRSAAEEWALVLLAEGLSPTVRVTEEGFAVHVPVAEADRAAGVLSAYQSENPSGSQRDPDRTGSPWRVATLVPGALLAFFWITGPRNPSVGWFLLGSGDAERIVSGEIWRAVTALTLHADLGHVMGNAIVGAVFLAGLTRFLGGGIACGLVLLTGAAGNLANAFLRGDDHVVVGASTAVFGALGLLAGVGVVRRHGTGGAWVPLAAGLGLMAMLGTGARADLWAHALGFLTGSLLGLGTASVLERPPGTVFQWLAGGAALTGVLGSWVCALG